MKARKANQSKSPRRLTPSFSKRLKSYAAAAGLGAFAFTQTSEATVIFTDVSPDQSIGVPGTIYINLNNSGYNEFAIAAITYQNQIRFNPYNIGPQASKVLTSSGAYYVYSFAPGATIGPASSEAGGARIGFRASAYPGVYYNFVGTGGYIGLKWDIGGGDYFFGWARVDVTDTDGGTATLYSYAYEDTPNTAIEAGAVPEPTSLALLAAGGGALALARKRRR